MTRLYDSAEVRQLAASVHTAAAKLESQVSVVVRASGLLVEKNAKEIIVAKDIIDTGATLNSVGVDVLDGGLTVIVGPTTHYSVYLENGTYRMEARPFMEPAANLVEPQFVEAIHKVAGDWL